MEKLNDNLETKILDPKGTKQERGKKTHILNITGLRIDEITNGSDGFENLFENIV